MDINTFATWFGVITNAATIIVLITYFLSKKQAATTESIEQLEDILSDKIVNQNIVLSDKIDGQNIRLAKVEQQLTHTLTANNLGDLHEKINLLDKEMNQKMTDLSTQIALVSGGFNHMNSNFDKLMTEIVKIGIKK